MPPSDQEIFARITRAAKLETNPKTGMVETEKEIAFWLRDNGIPGVPWADLGALNTWNSLQVIDGLLNLQKALGWGHASHKQSSDGRRLYPARELFWPESYGQEPEWLQERWESGIDQTASTGILRSPYIALLDHPIWNLLSDVSRPFAPFFCFTREQGRRVMERGVRRDSATDLGLIPRRGYAQPPPFEPWPDDGRLAFPEWMAIWGEWKKRALTD